MGCKTFEIFKKDPVTHCLGGVCEIRTKDPIQTLMVVLALGLGLYGYLTKVESKTFLAKKVKLMMMIEAERQAKIEASEQAEFDDF